jgi:hypothetical protein
MSNYDTQLNTTGKIMPHQPATKLSCQRLDTGSRIKNVIEQP